MSSYMLKAIIVLLKKQLVSVSNKTIMAKQLAMDCISRQVKILKEAVMKAGIDLI